MAIELKCRRVVYNPCGLDEYEVIITQDEKSNSILTLASPFETDEEICNRGYKEFLKKSKH